MPATRTKAKKEKDETASLSASNVVAFVSGGRKIALPRPQTYEDAVALAQKHCIPEPVPDFCVVVEARIPSAPELGLLELNSDVWPIISHEIKEFEIGYHGFVDNGPPKECLENVASGAFPIHIETTSGNTFTITVSSDHTVEQVKQHIQDRTNIPLDQQRLIFDGDMLDDFRNIRYYDIQRGDTIDVCLPQRAGKPIIYLYPPTTIKATVELFLSLDWSLSAVYPISPGLKPTRSASQPADYGRVVQWNVTAHPDGMMSVNTASGAVEATYLFWEADTHPELRQVEGSEISRLPSRVEDADLDFPKEFTPGSSQCSPQDSVLLPVDEIPDYLDKALLALGLHTEGRTSFITFWLPSILKHDHVALRFIHQYDLNCAAKLQISPTPDVVTRIFMLFQGVPSSEMEHWKDGMGQDNESKKGSVGKMWRDVVGVEAEDKQKDERLFRVVEWGGMEVLNARIR